MLALLAILAIPQPVKAPAVNFARDVLPALRADCFQCHGPQRQSGGLRLDSRTAAIRAGVIQPGHGAESLLVQRLLGAGGKARMPLGFAPLPAQQIAKIRAWIDQGAPWTASSTKHWAYVKPVRPLPPVVKEASWCRNAIDRFVVARLEKEHLKPSPPASREVLIRRVYLDLIGLPPSLKEVDALLADSRPDAYERLVDRLLASPHYGERWATPWLDLARYADTNGYEKDNRRSIWPFRDWVIHALNADMPFDQFTIEQIAGDLLPNSTLEQKVATGFQRNTMLNEEGGVDKEEQRWLTQVDRVGTTGTVWLGTTTACTQCHDHKYDPFTQKEFYQLSAFYEHTNEPSINIPSPENVAKVQSLQMEIGRLEQQAAHPAPDQKDLPAVKARLAEAKKELAAAEGPSTLVMEETQDAQIPSAYVRIKGAYLSKGELVQAGTPAVLNPWRSAWPRNRLGLAYWLVDKDNPLTARVQVNRLWEQCFGRGIVETSGDFGTQGTPPTHPELLDWLACEFMSPGVQVFRCSGVQDSGLSTPWSLKHILRLIVTSATYRQSSRMTPELRERDPDNRLLARGPRFRMPAEMIRDVSLEAAGQLSHKLGGPPVFPVQPEGIWDVPYSGDKWVTSPGEDKYRRGVYTFWRRSAPYPEFVAFDATSREFCTVRRVRTNTPLQALTTLNDAAYFEAAQALARRMEREGGTDPAAQITYGFRLCVTRRPDARELDRLLALYRQELAHYQARAGDAKKAAGPNPAAADAARTAALTVVANVLLNLDETLCKG